MFILASVIIVIGFVLTLAFDQGYAVTGTEYRNFWKSAMEWTGSMMILVGIIILILLAYR